MKKLLTVTLLAGLLSMPSVVFSDSGAVLYGSIRPSIQAGGGDDAKVFDNGSRWGIKGSAEASEGLTASFQFEQGLNTTDAKLYARRANAGLSGGFGTITIGKITSASYNHIGAILDQSQFYGSPETEGAPNSALSYAYSSGAVSFQVDLVSDGDTDSGGSIDKTDFGLTVGLGDIGKVAFAHTNQKDAYKEGVVTEAVKAVMPEYRVITTPADPANNVSEAYGVVATMIKVRVAKSNNDNLTGTNNSPTGRALNTAGTGQVVRNGDVYSIGNITDLADCAADADSTSADCAITVDAYVSVTNNQTNTGGGNPTITEDYHISGSAAGNVAQTVMEVKAKDAVMGRVLGDRGHKTSHVAVEFNVGGLTTWVGHKTKKTNGAAKKAKTTHFGVRGSLGDTGMSFVAIARNKKDAMGVKTSPWSIGMSRSLGGGAILRFEHANDDNDKSGKTGVGLQVNF